LYRQSRIIALRLDRQVEPNRLRRLFSVGTDAPTIATPLRNKAE
jgi:hypothetical protein